jgi:hypothetical protein
METWVSKHMLRLSSVTMCRALLHAIYLVVSQGIMKNLSPVVQATDGCRVQAAAVNAAIEGFGHKMKQNLRQGHRYSNVLRGMRRYSSAMKVGKGNEKQGAPGPVTSLPVRVRAFVYFPGQHVALPLLPSPNLNNRPGQCGFSNTSCAPLQSATREAHPVICPLRPSYEVCMRAEYPAAPGRLVVRGVGLIIG